MKTLKDDLFYYFSIFIFLLILFFIPIYFFLSVYNYEFETYGYTVIDFDNNVYFTDRGHQRNKDTICVKDNLCILPKMVEKTHVKNCTHLGFKCTDWYEIKKTND